MIRSYVNGFLMQRQVLHPIRVLYQFQIPFFVPIFRNFRNLIKGFAYPVNVVQIQIIENDIFVGFVIGLATVPGNFIAKSG
jgi:hypothetical protein